MDHAAHAGLDDCAGTLRDHEYLQLARAAEEKGEVFQLPEHIKARVDEQYQRDVIAVHGEEAGRMENEYKTFLQELGGEVPRPELEDGARDGPAGARHGLGFGGRGARDNKLDDDDPKALYIGYLPVDMGEDELTRLLETCGPAEDVRIVRDK